MNFAAFNRTYLELKLGYPALSVGDVISFNRTYLELKLVIAPFLPALTMLLIAPIWN